MKSKETYGKFPKKFKISMVKLNIKFPHAPLRVCAGELLGG